jgi:phospholipid/cholesterol/gamma-HCH transport system substrate-binding protein
VNASTDHIDNETGQQSHSIRRIAIAGVVVCGLLLAYFLLFRGGGYKYDLIFTTGGQLVRGNLVLVGGHPVGSIEKIALTDDNQARITVSIDQELHEGTTAVIRTTSLSGVANRYISLTPGPNSAPEIPEGGAIPSTATTSPVDLDQFFATFTPRMRKGLSDFFKGNATIWDGAGKKARTSFRYFSPALTQTTRWLREFNADERMLARFVSDSARLSATVAERGEQLTSLIRNSNQAFGAIADENESLSEALAALPRTMRQANTTFVNLRAAFDDVDPLIEAAKPATKDLQPFLQRLQPTLSRSVNVFRDLRLAMNRPNKPNDQGGPTYNDLGELTLLLPKLQPRTAKAFDSSIKAISDFQPTLDFYRPYWGEFINGFANLGQITGYYDANGHFARVQAAGVNLFDYDSGTETLNPVSMADQYNQFPGFAPAKRCPGGGTQPAADGSNPFYDPPWSESGLSGDDCNPAQVPPGP